MYTNTSDNKENMSKKKDYSKDPNCVSMNERPRHVIMMG